MAQSASPLHPRSRMRISRSKYHRFDGYFSLQMYVTLSSFPLRSGWTRHALISHLPLFWVLLCILFSKFADRAQIGF